MTLRPVGLLLLSVGLVVVPAEGLQAQPVTGNAADFGASGHRGRVGDEGVAASHRRLSPRRRRP